MQALRAPASTAQRAKPFSAVQQRPVSKGRAMSVRVRAAYDLDPDNASFLVCGGGGVALHVTRKLKNMGSWVWQLQRTDVRRKEIEGMMAIVAKGDAMNKEDLQKVFDSECGEKEPPRCTSEILLLCRHNRALSCSQNMLII